MIFMALEMFKSFGKFPRMYWVVQIFEMLERGAYYTMIPIIVVHAYFNVGLSVVVAAMITVFMYPFQYGLPILTGALAEKVGYKRQIAISFVILTAAYILLSMANNAFTMIFAVMAVGIGIGSYKPLVSAAIAKITTDEDRNIGYSIYYWVVNIGAFVFPMVYVVLEWFGVITRSTYSFVFLFGGLMVAINIFIALFLFEDIPRSGDVKTIRDVFNNIKTALVDVKFLVMVLLMGGFWGLYSSFLNALPLVLFGFKLVPIWFTPMLLGVFNPFTIIALGIPIGKFTERVDSIKALMGGVLLYVLGLALIAYTLQWIWVIFGIIIVSIGEFMVAPGYLSFVSKLAPKEKVSAYIGCNFLSTMIGLVGGTFVFSILVTYIAVDLARPHFFYGILTAIGFGILLGFMIYYKKWGEHILERARLIKEKESGVSVEKAVYDKEPKFFKIFDYKAAMVIPLALMIIIPVTTYSMGTDVFYGREGTIPVFSLDNYNITAGPTMTDTGKLNEGDSKTYTFDVKLKEGQLLKCIIMNVKWTDEPDMQKIMGTWVNSPDTFKLETSMDNYSKSDKAANDHGSPGSVSTSFEFTPTSADFTDGVGTWSAKVTLVDAGDYNSPLNFRTAPDTSNSYSFTITTEVYEPNGTIQAETTVIG